MDALSAASSVAVRAVKKVLSVDSMAVGMVGCWEGLMADSMVAWRVSLMVANWVDSKAVCWAGRKAALKEALSAASRDVLWVA